MSDSKGVGIQPQNYNQLTTHQRRELREQYVKSQKGLCYYCKRSLAVRPDPSKNRGINWKLFPPNFLRYPIHLHHNHKTGMTIGAVHALCNAILWQYHGE